MLQACAGAGAPTAAAGRTQPAASAQPRLDKRLPWQALPPLTSRAAVAIAISREQPVDAEGAGRCGGAAVGSGPLCIITIGGGPAAAGSRGSGEALRMLGGRLCQGCCLAVKCKARMHLQPAAARSTLHTAHQPALRILWHPPTPSSSTHNLSIRYSVCAPAGAAHSTSWSSSSSANGSGRSAGRRRAAPSVPMRLRCAAQAAELLCAGACHLFIEEGGEPICGAAPSPSL